MMFPRWRAVLCIAWFLWGSAKAFCPPRNNDGGGVRKHSTTNTILTSSNSDDKDETGVSSPSLSSIISRGGGAPIWQDLRQGYALRVAADPAFFLKSIVEVCLAAATQLLAEYHRRDQRWTNVLVRDIDFVVAAILAAVYGKYASMWKVAKTTQATTTSTTATDSDDPAKQTQQQQQQQDPLLGNMRVPTNAFQPFLLDGQTRPTIQQRAGSFVVPILPLFRAGLAAGLTGYGVTYALIALRGYLMPHYQAATQNVNILYAAVYTGSFMALVSNVRYQILQGIVEPAVDKVFDKMNAPLKWLQAIVIFVIRFGNGLLGSTLAIMGMRWLGLQKLK